MKMKGKNAFTLAEAAVALAVATLFLTLTFSLVSSLWQNANLAEQQRSTNGEVKKARKAIEDWFSGGDSDDFGFPRAFDNFAVMGNRTLCFDKETGVLTSSDGVRETGFSFGVIREIRFISSENLLKATLVCFSGGRDCFYDIMLFKKSVNLDAGDT